GPRHGAHGPVRGSPGRHVRGEARRGVAGPRYLREPAPSLHGDADRHPAVPRPEGVVPGHPRPPAAAPGPAPRVCVPSPVSRRVRPLPGGGPGVPRGPGRLLGGVPPRVAHAVTPLLEARRVTKSYGKPRGWRLAAPGHAPA